MFLALKIRLQHDQSISLWIKYSEISVNHGRVDWSKLMLLPTPLLGTVEIIHSYGECFVSLGWFQIPSWSLYPSVFTPKSFLISCISIIYFIIGHSPKWMDNPINLMPLFYKQMTNDKHITSLIINWPIKS